MIDGQAQTPDSLRAEELASLYYTLAKNELSPKEMADMMRKFWRLHDPKYTLLDMVASRVNELFKAERQKFLSSCGYFRFLAELLCWEFPINEEIFMHSLKDLTPPDEHRFTLFWGRLDPGYVIARLSDLKGGERRAHMQLIALRNLVFESVDPELRDFRKTLTVCYILIMLLLSLLVPILVMCVLGWRVLTLDYHFFERMIYGAPLVYLCTWQWVLTFGVCVGLFCIGLIAVDPYKTELKDHAHRVLTLYLTLAAGRLAPVLSKTASYYELLWTLWKCSQGVHVNKMYMPYVLWLLFATFVIQPKVSLWARTMKARIPILEAQVHLKLCKIERLPNPKSWVDRSFETAQKKKH